MHARMLVVALFAVSALMSQGCLMLRSTHCKFVNDVGAAATELSQLAETKGDPSQQAVAKQLNGTVQSEQQESCK